MSEQPTSSGAPATPFSLEGKTALVTGGAKRIGRALALALAEAGANVLVHYRSSAGETAEVCTEAEEFGVSAKAVQADLSAPRDWEAFIADCRVWRGSLDILVNNASMYPSDQLGDFNEASFLENMRVHALTPALLIRAFAAGLERGRIVNLLDTRILGDDRTHLSYHLSKRTLHSLTKLAALEYAPRITVNAIAPGPILPPPGEGAEYMERARGFVPLNRTGTLKEIADAVLFLLRSDFITGQVLFVDGGRHLYGGPYG